MAKVLVEPKTKVLQKAKKLFFEEVCQFFPLKHFNIKFIIIVRAATLKGTILQDFGVGIDILYRYCIMIVWLP